MQGGEFIPSSRLHGIRSFFIVRILRFPSMNRNLKYWQSKIAFITFAMHWLTTPANFHVRLRGHGSWKSLHSNCKMTVLGGHLKCRGRLSVDVKRERLFQIGMPGAESPGFDGDLVVRAGGAWQTNTGLGVGPTKQSVAEGFQRMKAPQIVC